jgi:hypothetical protein
VVGVHGRSFNRPFASYLRDCTTFHFAGSMRSERAVDILGTGTMMFDTAVFRFDVRKWQQLNMSDLNVAIEATKSGLPMICIARRKNFLFPLGENQSDSAFRALQNDDSRYTSRALELLALRAAENNLAPSAQRARPIGRVTKPRLTCSITSNASTMLNADTRQSATEAPWSSRCRRD